MALIDAYEDQKIHISRDTMMGDEGKARQNAALVGKAVDEYIVGAGVTIRIEDGGSSKTWHEGDPIRRGLDVRSSSDFGQMLQRRDVLKISKSQILINTDDPAAQFIVNPQGSSVSVATGIIATGKVISAADCHKEPEPPNRTKYRGVWVEAGEWHPGLDGEQVLKSLIARGLVIDRTLGGKLKRAVKATVRKRKAAGE